MDSDDIELKSDATDALTDLSQAQGWLQPGARIETLSRPGEGNMNRVLRAHTDQGQTLIFKQSVSWVAKYPQIPAPIERLDTEVAFYACLADYGALAMRTPKILGYDARNHLLCMEDLGDVPDMTDLYRQTDSGTRFPELTALTYWLWKLHALPATTLNQATFANSAMRQLNHEHIFRVPFDENNGVALSDKLAASAETVRHSDLSAAARRLGDVYLGHAPHDSSPCLLHGDFYPGSWVRHCTMGVMIIDPEFAFIGPPEFDVGVMLAHLTLCSFEQTDLMRLLQSYVPPPGFSVPLALSFAGIEIIRRLLGVAQLPLRADDEQQVAWLQRGAELLAAA